MAYVTYTTEAIVCGSWSRNTADGSYLLFTKEAGMLYADARSVREERSRQRYSLQEFSHIRVSLVKGKAGWKIGSVTSLKNYYHEAYDKIARGSVVSVIRLLRRFVRGEEPAPDLYHYVSELLALLACPVPQRTFVQIVAQVEVLARLGYVDVRKLPPALQHCALADIAAQHTSEIEQKIEQLYTHAVSVSHL